MHGKIWHVGSKLVYNINYMWALSGWGAHIYYRHYTDQFLAASVDFNERIVL